MPKTYQLAILGAGKWGTTLALIYGKLALQSAYLNKVSLWVRPESKYHKTSLCTYLQKQRVNLARFPEYPDVRIPANVSISSDLSETLANAEIVISTIPSKYLASYLPLFKKHLTKKKFYCFVNASKGVIDDQPISYYFAQNLPDCAYATISGPNIASQIYHNFKEDSLHSEHLINPAFTTLAYDHFKNPDLLSILNAKPYLRMYRHHDIAAIEYCGILKQVYAMALGVCMGLGLPANTIAGLFHKCGEEITRILAFYKLPTNVYYQTLAGVADLEVTYKYGRNGKLGYLIATEGMSKATDFMSGECVEGLRVLRSIYHKTKDTNLHLPILQETYKVVYEHKPVLRAAQDLVNS
mgnify:FL=1|jgi:glycerol-3-phosphate dehydrogenase (NAD(P)+)